MSHGKYQKTFHFVKGFNVGIKCIYEICFACSNQLLVAKNKFALSLVYSKLILDCQKVSIALLSSQSQFTKLLLSHLYQQPNLIQNQPTFNTKLFPCFSSTKYFEQSCKPSFVCILTLVAKCFFQVSGQEGTKDGKLYN